MVEIGGRPILWHIMKHLRAHYGFSDFVVALGYRAEVDQATTSSTTTALHATTSRSTSATAQRSTSTTAHRERLARHAGRHRRATRRPAGGVKRLAAATSATSTFMRHLRRRRRRRRHRRAARLPPAPRQAGHGHRRPAAVALRRSRRSTATRVAAFREKPQIDEGWINGGFFVFEPRRVRLPRRRRHASGARAAGAAGRRRPARWPTATTASGSRWTPTATFSLLERAVAERQGALEGLGR